MSASTPRAVGQLPPSVMRVPITTGRAACFTSMRELKAAIMIIALLGVAAPDQSNTRAFAFAQSGVPGADFGRIAVQIRYGLGDGVESISQRQRQTHDRTVIVERRQRTAVRDHL